MSTTYGMKFFDEQLAYLAANDTDGLVDYHYAEDGEIIGFDFNFKGRPALKAHFKRYMEMLGYIKVLSTQKFTETADTIFFEASVETKLGVVTVYDAFVFNEQGQATHHFTGVK